MATPFSSLRYSPVTCVRARRLRTLRDMLLKQGERYMHLADLKSYLEADERLCALYADPDEWARKAILNAGGAGQILQRPNYPRIRCRSLERAIMSSPGKA